MAWGLYPTQILAGTSLVIALLLSIIYIQATGLLEPLLPMLDTSQLRAEQKFWVKLSERFPTHRDILLNTALIEEKLHAGETANIYWQKAWLQDPNSPFFTTHALSGTPLPSALSQN